MSSSLSNNNDIARRTRHVLKYGRLVSDLPRAQVGGAIQAKQLQVNLVSKLQKALHGSMGTISNNVNKLASSVSSAARATAKASDAHLSKFNSMFKPIVLNQSASAPSARQFGGHDGGATDVRQQLDELKKNNHVLINNLIFDNLGLIDSDSHDGFIQLLRQLKPLFIASIYNIRYASVPEDKLVLLGEGGATVPVDAVHAMLLRYQQSVQDAKHCEDNIYKHSSSADTAIAIKLAKKYLSLLVKLTYPLVELNVGRAEGQATKYILYDVDVLQHDYDEHLATFGKILDMSAIESISEQNKLAFSAISRTTDAIHASLCKFAHSLAQHAKIDASAFATDDALVAAVDKWLAANPDLSGPADQSQSQPNTDEVNPLVTTEVGSANIIAILTKILPQSTANDIDTFTERDIPASVSQQRPPPIPLSRPQPIVNLMHRRAPPVKPVVPETMGINTALSNGISEDDYFNRRLNDPTITRARSNASSSFPIDVRVPVNDFTPVIVDQQRSMIEPQVPVFTQPPFTAPSLFGQTGGGVESYGDVEMYLA